MDRETLAKKLGEAEFELRAAQDDLDGTARSIIRYRDACLTMKHLNRLVSLVLAEGVSAGR